MHTTILDNSIYKDRVVVASPDYFEVKGTDTNEDTNRLLGKKYEAYRKAWIDNPKNKIVSEFPLHLDVESSNTCNLRCTMCQIPFGKMEAGYLRIDVFESILNQVKEHFLPSMKFNFRGEPLMHPKIDKLVRMAKEAGVLEVQFNSNGALLTEGLGEKLIDAGLDRIKFSVDSLVPETYNLIRRGTDYDKTIGNILSFINMRNRLKKKMPIIQVQMVYMESNHKEILKYIEFWQDKVNRIGFSRYRSGNNRNAEERVGKVGKRIPCPQLWQRMVVLWDGTVLMCCGDYNMKNPIGNIERQKLADIWKGTQLQHYRKLHLQHKFNEIDACRKCEINYE